RNGEQAARQWARTEFAAGQIQIRALGPRNVQHLGDAADPGPRLAREPEAEIVWRHAGRAAAGAGIADEGGDIRAVRRERRKLLSPMISLLLRRDADGNVR